MNPIIVDDAFLVALAGVIAAASAAVGAWLANQRSARRDEVDLLRSEVARLQQRVERLMDENQCLYAGISQLREENATLRGVLAAHGIPVPEPLALVLRPGS